MATSFPAASSKLMCLGSMISMSNVRKYHENLKESVLKELVLKELTQKEFNMSPTENSNVLIQKELNMP